MFDNVGKNLDDEAAKRSFASVLITSLLLGSGAAFMVAWTTYKVVEEFHPELLDDEMVEVIQDEGIDEEAPPPPPPPPPPPAAADDEEEEDEEEDTTTETEEMVDEQKELEEKVDTKIKTQERPKGGVKDGVEGGVEGGVIGGVKDGIKDGVIGGQLDGGLHKFYHSDLDVKRKKLPRYPQAAEALNLGDQRCRVTVKIDEKGVPFSAVVTGCPKVFHDEARSAILQWRWYPPKVGKQKVKAQTLIAVVFKAR